MTSEDIPFNVEERMTLAVISKEAIQKKVKEARETYEASKDRFNQAVSERGFAELGMSQAFTQLQRYESIAKKLGVMP